MQERSLPDKLRINFGDAALKTLTEQTKIDDSLAAVASWPAFKV